MSGLVQSSRISSYQPALAWFAALGAGWVFVLVMLGAFTTSIGAGMVFADWPLSDGSLNPAGWLHNLAEFAEHSHRLSAGLMSAVTLVLAGWLWRCEARGWLRWLGWFAVALVLLQAVVGGLRVLLNPVAVTAVDTSLGQLFAMLHACLAQIFVCTLFAVAAALSRPWIEGGQDRLGLGAGVRRLGLVCCGLLLVQLAIAAVMRHTFSGLAIPTFPLTPDGTLVPAQWDFHVGINFAHRVTALVLAGALGWLAVRVWRDPAAGAGCKGLAGAMVALLGAQLLLGAAIVWTGRNPYFTTAHVLVGALTLAVTFLLTWLAHREKLDGAVLGGAPGGRALPAQSRSPGASGGGTVGFSVHA
jgi:heme a synthase